MKRNAKTVIAGLAILSVVYGILAFRSLSLDGSTFSPRAVSSGLVSAPPDSSSGQSARDSSQHGAQQNRPQNSVSPPPLAPAIGPELITIGPAKRTIRAGDAATKDKPSSLGPAVTCGTSGENVCVWKGEFYMFRQSDTEPRVVEICDERRRTNVTFHRSRSEPPSDTTYVHDKPLIATIPETLNRANSIWHIVMYSLVQQAQTLLTHDLSKGDVILIDNDAGHRTQWHLDKGHDVPGVLFYAALTNSPWKLRVHDEDSLPKSDLKPVCYSNAIIGSQHKDKFEIVDIKETMMYIRGSVLEYLKIPNTRINPDGFIPRVLLIQRRFEACRYIVNIDNLREGLRDELAASANMRPEDVVITEASLEYLTTKEQIDLFVSHNIVVSAHGAGLAWITFLPVGGTVIEIFPPGWYTGDYAEWSEWSCHRYSPIRVAKDEVGMVSRPACPRAWSYDDPRSEQIIAPVERVRKALNQAIITMSEEAGPPMCSPYFTE